MNKNRITLGNGKLKKRFVSILTAATVATSSLPIAYIAELYGGISTKLSAFAAGTGATQEFNTVTEFKNYVASYTASNKNDKLVFAITDGSSSNNEINIDTPMGASQDAAFDGEIIIQAPIKFNISKPLFKYVTDDVEIKVTYTGGTAMEFTRPTEGTQAPLFAEHVINSRSSGIPVKWNFRYDKYSRDNSVYDFAGFIGVMEADAKVEIESVVLNNKGKDQNNNDKTANIVANSNGDAGLICGTMKANAELTVDEVTCSGDNADASFSIKASSGSAGGLVGSMASGSTITLKSGLSCAQAAGAEINANNGTNGYAGGLVGKCDKGIIINNSTTYTVAQTISGAKGSGGVAGYYETSSSNNTVNTNLVDLSTGGYKVNGAGQCGGLFGEAFNNGQDMTITVNEDIVPDHNDGGAASYGGLIGKYTSSAQTLSLNIVGSNSKEITPSKSSGTAASYGGVIGNVDLSSTSTSSYVKIDGVKVESANAAVGSATGYFGGVIGKADNAFIELVNTNTISYSDINKDNAFAGVVGNLESGVLCLSGTTDLSGAEGITTVNKTSGQIVGYRNCGFVFAKSGWKLYRSSTGQKVDDIGSWGEVIRFGGSITENDVITVDTSNHTVTIKKRASYSGTNYCKDLSNATEFANIALNIQHNCGSDFNVLLFEDKTNFTSTKILGYDFSFAATTPIDLSGTGITGLTRDNSYDGTDFTSYMTYTGTSSSLKNMNGGNSTIKLAIGEEWGDVLSPSYGNGTIYRHKYNGLIARTNYVTFSNGDYGNKTLTLTGEINVEACTSGVNVGSLVANTINKVQIDNVNCNTTINHAGNGSDFFVGGFIGIAKGNVTFGQNSGRPCSFGGSIIGSSSKSSAVVGGLIGCVNGNFTSNIYNATVSGTIQSQGGEADQKIGGLIGVINGSTTNSKLNLKNVSVTGLTVESNATNSSGGLLGYGWYNTAVSFVSSSSGKGIEITSSKMKTTASNTAGLVYEGTGHWIVNSNGTNKEGIRITSATIDAANAESFGGIINRGCANGAAIYLELKYSGGCGYKIDSLTTTDLNSSVSVFDEIAAYSKFDDTDITDNGQAVISINTSNNANTQSQILLKMDDSNTGLTYANQSGFTPKYNNATDYCNPNTRYYYNLGLIKGKSSKTAADNFMLWSVEQYAHSSIKSNFTGGNSGTEDADINLRGYSYYPINIDKDEEYTIAGKISLWNAEFDATEENTTWKRKSFGTARNSQHYLMQNGLFLNVNGTLNATSLELNGDVSKISNDLCGALVMGTVSSDSSTNPAIVTVDGLVLNGIKVNGTHNASTYAPLLINKSGSNTTFDVENVSATTLSGSTANTAYTAEQLIASSLIGNLGGADATFVKISFSGIKLDGRNATGDIDNLDSVYATKKSLFSRSTLLNSLKYSDNSSYGTYYFGFGEDYDTENGNTKLGNVTYGKEIRDTVENRDDSNISKQLKYDGSSEYVRPENSSSTDTNGFAGFSTNYQKYVYDGYVAENNTENKHELQVNIASASFSGCGTYNDPYIITKGDELETIAKIINGIDATTSAYSITVPKSVVDSPSSAHSWCITDENNNKEHYTFTSFTKGSTRDASTWSTSDSTPVTISDSTLAKYLVGAYYKLNSTGDIELKTTFPGISTNVDSDYAFHGVIDGNGKSVVNRSVLPLISSSDGCVIMNLNITANPTESISLTANKVAFDTTSASAHAYGVLIGKVLGGDNIIDHVTAGFTGTGKISITGDKIVPVGGYIGVVRNGGVIFRNMSSYAASDRSGIKDSAFTGLTTPVTGNDNLYINPIIGRVLNGYAVTVAASGSTNDYKAREEDYVTMKNGTKNYSIADIDPDFYKLATTSDTIKLPNAQSMFILSLLTQSGLTVASYGDYGTHFHKAAYNEIGSSALTTGDYANATATRPYIVEYYLDSTAQSSLFTLTGTGTEWNLSLGGTNLEWEIPDGFRGIGSLGFDQTSDAYVTARTLNLKNFSGIGSYGEATYTAEDTEHKSPTNIIDLQLNINVKHYSSGVDNYVPVNTGNGGLGLFDKFRQINSSSNEKISYVKISGEINYNVPDVRTYNQFYIDNNYLHVGGLAGCIGTGATTDTDNIIVEQVNIDGLEVNGFESAGGFFGYLKMANSANGQVTISDVSADTFTVSAKQYAGGIIGYFGQGNLTVSGVTITSPVILSYYHGYMEGTGDYVRKDFDNGVGGIVGFAFNNTNNKPISFSGVTLGKAKKDYTEGETNRSYIGYENNQEYYSTKPGNKTGKSDDTVAAGGLVGRSHTKGKTGSTYTMEIDTCKIYNINLYGHRVAGLLGSDRENDSVIHINNCNVISDLDTPAEIYGVTVDSGDRGCGGLVGGNSNGGLTVENTTVEGYIINGLNDTGGVCAWLNAGKLTIHNFTIKDVTIASNYSGCIVGFQNTQIEGYNILADNIQFQASDRTATIKNDVAYIIGKNFNGAGLTKIVGFTRKNTTPKDGCVVPDRMTGLNSGETIGNGCAKSKTTSYKGGYVIFADYQGSQAGTAFSDINAGSNITGDPKSPYVYSSPSVTISDGDENQNTSPQILTGDGVSGYTYLESSAGLIFRQKSDTTNLKRYQSCTLTNEAVLGKVLENNTSSFTRELQKSGISSYSGNNFPVLVIDDKDNVDTIVKDYIRLLTNTSYNYDGKTSAESSIYSINVSKMKYNSTKKNFETPIDQSTNQPEPAALIYSISTGKYSIGDVYDNTDERFSLIDVQFKNPSGDGKIAYHLYIPVMIEKCLYYTVEIRPASGSTYNLDEYPDSRTNLIENLGNPVTIKLTYKYDQGYAEWTKAINNGEKVLRNYNKEIIIKCPNLLSSAMAVIVDPNNNSDTMRSGILNSSGTGALLTQTATNTYKLTVADTSQVCKLNDLMKISIDNTATEKKLVSCSASDATVMVNYPDNSSVTYLRPATDNERTNNSIQKYAVKAEDWGTKSIPEENYYISIFTQEDKSDNNIYHYEIDTDLSLGDYQYPSSKTNEEAPHVLIGNLYNNSIITVNEGNPDTSISKSNNTLSATITAQVGFSQSALDNDITSLITGNENLEIYQEFLVSLQKIVDNATSLGFEIMPECSFTYAINGTPVDDTFLLDSKKMGIYVELPNEQSIKQALIDKVTAWKALHPTANTVDADECKITLTSTVTMSYAKYEVDELAEQFPEISNVYQNGTKIVGYSKIASAQNSVALSHASDNKAGNRLYNMESASPVILKYIPAENSSFANDGNADLGQLGVNAQPDAAEISGGKSKIKTLISYDASDFAERERAEYLMLSFTLQDKNTSNGASEYGSNLSIGDYLDGFKVNDYLYPPAPPPESGEEESTTPTITVTESNNVRTFKIPLDSLSNDGRYDYVIPVEFDVLSGSAFEAGETKKYSNYRISVEVGLLGADNTTTPLLGSVASDWIIYTNARIKRDIITDS